MQGRAPGPANDRGAPASLGWSLPLGWRAPVGTAGILRYSLEEGVERLDLGLAHVVLQDSVDVLVEAAEVAQRFAGRSEKDAGGAAVPGIGPPVNQTPVHAHAPRARMAFNTGPRDSTAAIQRWA